jgi:hypothetical protein
MERIQRWREPAVVVVAAALLVRLVLVALFAGTSARLGLDQPTDAAYLASRQLSDPTLVVVLTALVLACHVRPATRHVRLLTGVGLAVAALSVVLAVVLAFVGYRAYTPPFSQLDFLDRLVGLVVPLVAVAALGVLLQRPPREREALTAAPPAAPELPAEEDRAALPATRPDPALEPTWQPDEAAGAAWYTAGDAASGRPAAGWGSPDGASGWQPVGGRPAPEPGTSVPAEEEPGGTADGGRRNDRP